jgi:biotin-(acetyl-CoA carboxylase) ligase
MLIVSQIREMVVNLDTICVLGINKNNSKEILSTTNNGNTQTLAKYETRERAKEVLQDILKEYKKVLTTFNRGTGQQRFYDLPKIYYMPEK